MKASKILVSTAAAVTVVGVMGFALAQTSMDKPAASATNPNMQNSTPMPDQSTPNSSGMQNRQPDGSTATMNRDTTGTMTNERMARADRN